MQTPPEHYYGDIVRKLFLTAAVIMLASYPIFSPDIPQRPVFTIIAIALVSVMAGLTNPRQRWTSVIDLLISLVGVMAFESYAVKFATPELGGLSMANQLLVLIFFLALYFSLKTVRGMSLNAKSDKY